MSKKNIWQFSVLAILGAVYIIFFADWFASRKIQVFAQIRPTGMGGRRGAAAMPASTSAVYPVTFTLEKPTRLTQIKVVAEADFKANKFPHPVWHLVADSESPPLGWLFYGQPINGMKPAVPHMKPEPLQPDVPYLLFLEAGRAKGMVKFQTREIITPGG